MFIAQPPREWLFLVWREQIVIFLSQGRAKHVQEYLDVGILEGEGIQN
jgi:hypothetical protein